MKKETKRDEGLTGYVTYVRWWAVSPLVLMESADWGEWIGGTSDQQTVAPPSDNQLYDGLLPTHLDGGRQGGDQF